MVNFYERERFTNIVFGVLSNFEKVFHSGIISVIHNGIIAVIQKRCTAFDVDVVHLRFEVRVNQQLSI